MTYSFTKQLPDFLWELRFNNNKQWFDEHRELYTSGLQKPLKELAGEMFEYLSDKYTSHVFKLHISRINRDLRRPSPFGPYKDHMWFSLFNAFADEYDRPSFYVSVSPEGWSVGCGIFKAPQTVTMKYREKITTMPEKINDFAKAVRESSSFELRGDDYKRSKGDAGKLLTPWLNKKELYVSADFEYGDLFYSDNLSEFVKSSFDFLMPYYEFLEQICEEVRDNQ